MSSPVDVVLSAWPIVLIATLGYIVLRKPKVLPGLPHDPVYRRLSGHARELIAAERSGRGASEYFREYASKWGSVCQILLGKKAVVVVSDPKELELILRRNSSSFCRSDRFRVSFAWTLPYGQIGMDEGPMWRSHRKLMGPSMLPPFLSRMAPRINQHICELIELWDAKYDASRRLFEKGAAFEADPDVHLLMMDTISHITFGKSLAGVQASLALLRQAPHPLVDGDRRVKFPSPPNRHYAVSRRLFAMMDRAITSGFPRLAYYVGGFLSPSWHSARTFFRAVLSNTLFAYRERIKSGNNPPTNGQPGGAVDLSGGDNNAESVLGLLFDKPEEKERTLAESMPEREVLDELALFFFAGQDTTASALLWSLKLLTLNPHVQHKLRNELMTAHNLPVSSQNRRTLSYEELQNKHTPYLDAVVYECLRLAHVVGVVSRQAKHDTVIGGYIVPKGTEILLLFNAVNVNGFGEAGRQKTTETFDGTLFRPERWLNGDGEFDGNAWPLYAFSAGARRCFGQKLATLSLKLALGALNLAFFFDRLPSAELEGWEVKEGVVREPLKSWIMPRKWDDL